MFELTPTIAKLKIKCEQEIGKCADCTYGKECKIPRKDYCLISEKIERIKTKISKGD